MTSRTVRAVLNTGSTLSGEWYTLDTVQKVSPEIEPDRSTGQQPGERPGVHLQAFSGEKEERSNARAA